MDDNGNIFHNDINIILEDSKMICSDFDYHGLYQTEFYTYNIAEVFHNVKKNMTKKEVFEKLYYHIFCHILKPRYRYKNYIFLLCLEEKTDENIKMLDIEIKLGWDWSIPLGNYLRNEVENMYEDDDFLYTNNNVKLIIMAQEVSSLEENNQIKKSIKIKHTKSKNVLYV